MNLFAKTAATGLMLSVASFASATTISGSTDFRVTLPEILVLYHWDDAHLVLTDVTPTEANDSDSREISDATTRQGGGVLTASPYTIGGNEVSTTTPTNATALDGTVDVTLQNSWAVRSLSNADVTLNLTIQQDTLKNVVNQESKITVQNAVLQSTSQSITSGTGSQTLEIASGWQPVKGDIKFTLDLSAANHSGEYNARGAAASGAVDESQDTFLLKLTGN